MRTLYSAVIWAVATVMIILLVTLPINTRTQLIASILIVTVMAIIKLLDVGGKWRLVALAFGTGMVLRYVYWRTTSTLPPVNQLENFIPGMLVYLAEMYSVLMLSLSLSSLPCRCRRRGQAADRAATKTCRPSMSLCQATTRTNSFLPILWPLPATWIIRRKS
ncbi:hypothetical protein GGE35_005310 [Rhizobium cellulosilyticum]|uniref:Uncharacterized protein n=1 Tax=Aliirhizobium cellulosilyticum TaxID=393664 RepID=A0A7W6V3V1_9HYPH|nr:hypothetical protein [Rhizobium cellulosilyticum]